MDLAWADTNACVFLNWNSDACWDRGSEHVFSVGRTFRMKVQVFRHVTPSRLVNSYRRFGREVASIFRGSQFEKSGLCYSSRTAENEGTTLIRNVRNFTSRHGVTSLKTRVFMYRAVRISFRPLRFEAKHSCRNRCSRPPSEHLSLESDYFHGGCAEEESGGSVRFSF